MIDIVIPTIDGREVYFATAVALYSERTTLPHRIWSVENYPTVGEAWNAGAELVGGERGKYLHLTNDDIEPVEGWDTVAVAAADAGHLPSPKLWNSDGSVYAYGRHTRGPEPADGTYDGFSAIPFMTWEMWDRVGPCIPVHYYSDNWISWRAEQEGLEVRYYSGYGFVHTWAQPGRGAGMSEGRRMTHDQKIFEKAQRGFRR